MVHALVGLELRTYREAIASALQIARPQAVVSTTEPEALESEISRLEPHMVLCTQSTPALRDGVPCWVQMSIVEEELCAEVSLDGQTRRVSNITLAELVSVVDEAEALAQGGEAYGYKEL